MRGAPYSMRLWKAFGTHVLPLSLDLPTLDEEHDDVERESEMYCSQLAARTLQDCGALDARKPCHAFKPSDFWHCMDMPWTEGFAPATQHHARVVFPSGRLSLRFFEYEILRAERSCRTQASMSSLLLRLRSATAARSLVAARAALLQVKSEEPPPTAHHE
jgi:hypothetical protein